MFDKIYLFLCRLPNKLGVDRTKQSNIASWHFWYRQLFHMMGGIIVGGLWGWNWILWIFLSFAFMIFIVHKEIEDTEGGQKIVKGIFDVIFWLSGLALGQLIWGWIL